MEAQTKSDNRLRLYCKKPAYDAPAAPKLVRVCLRLDCQRNFVADGPFQRLCDLHRNGDE